ncbi:hypothetical protein [Longimicrobium sp.]|uniref:hypothetical protein n=1 Tax=Longimicrobium sp. TaxID=2029185 RepID=UPI003B3AEE6B
MTEMLQRAFEMASTLPADEQDALAAHMMEEIHAVAEDPFAETMETFLGNALHRPAPTAAEMAELRALAEKEPGIAAALRLAERGGLDVEAILAVRNAE